jgi:oligopeptidase A
MNALLDTAALPDFDAVGPADVGPAIEALITRQADTIAVLTETRPTAFEAAWLPLERIDVAIDNAWSTVSHLHGVADTPELRAAHAAGQQALVEQSLKVGQNRDLFDVLEALAASPSFADLPRADRTAVERALRDFRMSGVALEPAQRKRYAEVQMALSGLSNAFGSALLDATEAWTELVVDEAQLEGLSPADKGMLAAAASATGREGWLVTLQQPSVSAILGFAENRDLRYRVYHAYGTRASDQGPNAGTYDNGPRIAEILALRRESAAILGFTDPVALSLSTKMASDPHEVLAFLRDLAKRARPAAEADIASLRTFARESLGIDDLQPWDTGFTANRLRLDAHAIDEQAVRAYFPVDRVLAGWTTLLGRLFGIRLVERPDIATWHPDARYHDLVDADGTVFAGLYTDLHARTGKRGGAWMAQARSRVADGDATTLPVAYLTCNFAPTGGAVPPLLSHGDVMTLLHETGHCLHHLFGLIDRPSVGGITGFEWDAVELPSQLMEDFAWDRDVLTAMSGHYETGAPLPADLFDKLVAARHFLEGMATLRQVEFAMFDLLLHLGTMGDDPVAVLNAVRDEVAVTRPPDWHRFPQSFSHIFSGGYAAGYYSYLWAEVLAADAFGRFKAAGLVDRATGDALREHILSQGSARPALESFRAFMGRDPDPAALLVRRGLTA